MSPTLNTRPIIKGLILVFINYISWMRHYAITRRVVASITDVIGFFNGPNPTSRTMALGSTQRVTEMSTRNLPGCKWRPARKAGNFTAICEPIA
jgi:hypothetical protein